MPQPDILLIPNASPSFRIVHLLLQMRHSKWRGMFASPSL